MHEKSLIFEGQRWYFYVKKNFCLRANKKILKLVQKFCFIFVSISLYLLKFVVLTNFKQTVRLDCHCWNAQIPASVWIQAIAKTNPFHGVRKMFEKFDVAFARCYLPLTHCCCPFRLPPPRQHWTCDPNIFRIHARKSEKILKNFRLKLS